MATPKLARRRADFESPGNLALALECLTSGDVDGGYKLLLDARKRNPLDPKAANFLGMLEYDFGHVEKARLEFSAAVQLSPGVSAYSYNEATALLLSNFPREALSAYLRSLRGDELLADAHQWAWNALQGCGKDEYAKDALRTALRRDDSPHHLEQSTQRRNLEVVTLCIIDCIDTDLAIRSLRRSMSQCRFGAVKLLTSLPVQSDGIEIVRIDHVGSVEEYSRFIMKDLYRHIETDFALVTQWDGYVVNANAWSEDFIGFDYIGATWDADLLSYLGADPLHSVGNGGFSLRSRNLLQAGIDPRLIETHPEDGHLCRTYRSYLEHRYGIRFADAAIANRFSFESNRPEITPFGFHGAYNICCYEPDPRWIRFEFVDLG